MAAPLALAPAIQQIQVARDGPLTVVLSGAFERPPESERTPQHDALDVIKAYRKCDWEHPQFGGGSGVLSTGAEPTAAPAALLGGMHGRFAFVLYDSSENRTVAARDRNGNEQLFWGSPTMGDGLLFASSRDLLEEQAADVDVFPAGTFFVSDKDGSGSGTLLDFDRADLCTGARDAGAEAREAAADDNQEQSRDGGADDRGGEQAAQRAVEECRTASHGNLEDLATAMKRSASIQDLAAA